MDTEKPAFFLPLHCQLRQHNASGFPPGLLYLDYQSPADDLADWAMLLPPSGDTSRWLVVIHGHGGKGNQLYLRLDIRKYWLPQFLASGYGILTPNLRGNAWMGPAAVQDMDALLNFLRQEFSAEQFFFISGSMGATSNLIYAALRPDNVAGVVARGAVTDLAAYHAFCRQDADAPAPPGLPKGSLRRTAAIRSEIADSLEQHYGGTPATQADLYRTHSPLFNHAGLRGKPIYLIHGTADELMPVSQSRRFAGAMAEEENFTYCEIPAGNHDSPLTFGLTEQTPEVIFSHYSVLDWITRRC
jgi:pimeloyl-ACP methyl ester carboxylesterase